MDEETKQELEDLKRQLASLQGSIKPQVEVKFPPPRKLSVFNGVDGDVVDWVEDAKGAIRGMSNDEKVAFIKRHLQGEARQEINVQLPATIKTVDNIFEILTEAFGDLRTAGKIKRLLFSTVQGENETVREFTRRLMNLASKLSKESEASKEKMLKEAIADNLRSKTIKDEIDKMLSLDPDIPFADVRAQAIRMGDRDHECRARPSRARVNHIEADDDGTLADDSDDSINPPNQLEAVTAAIHKLAVAQERVLDLLTKQQVPTGPPATYPQVMAQQRQPDMDAEPSCHAESSCRAELGRHVSSPESNCHVPSPAICSWPIPGLWQQRPSSTTIPQFGTDATVS